ncbi:MAG: 16S rRNA (guanine(966)-N(2))-methyltransferase RsmD [Kiritimatiellia bacterium]|jgi:16S rRNA (guanine(966)-N(2))-methyltransferase RsmD|nr:16S rRNA (guanine(966)-N(2))-methyltransferase RsmD [Kiritimatiellia bacterium]
MRITGGEWGGRKLKAPAGDRVRPTQDRVREALFSMLMGVVPDALFVDLFAGTGAVGLEALSRGASRAVWVEQDPRHAALLQENVTALTGKSGEVCRCEVFRWLKGAGCGLRADVVFADPPYAAGGDPGFARVMGLLEANRVLRPGGVFVAEMPEACAAEEVAGWVLLRDRTYGHTRLAVYRLETKGTETD